MWTNIARWFRVRLYNIKRSLRLPHGSSLLPQGGGFLRPDQLEEARRFQDFRLTKEDLMDDERSIQQYFAQEMGIPFVDIERQSVPAEAIAAISGETARLYRVVPVMIRDRHLWVAMTEPNNLIIVDKLATESGCIITPVMAVHARIFEAIETYYPVSGDVS